MSNPLVSLLSGGLLHNIISDTLTHTHALQYSLSKRRSYSKKFIRNKPPLKKGMYSCEVVCFMLSIHLTHSFTITEILLVKSLTNDLFYLWHCLKISFIFFYRNLLFLIFFLLGPHLGAGGGRRKGTRKCGAFASAMCR